MAQVKVYGLADRLRPIRRELSEAIHSCVMEALGLPEGKRAHRFFPLESGDLLAPEGRSDAYTIIEIVMIEGRTVATRKRLIRLLFERIEERLGIEPMDLEICILESPAHNWGFRGFHGDEIELDYDVEV